MRIFVVFEGSRLNLDIKPDDAVRKVKNIVKKKMLINTQEDKKQGKILDVKFGGASLKDEWILSDLGITSGSTVRCALKTVHKPKLRVLLGYNSEIFDILEDINPITTTISTIKSIISRELGIPVSAYRLCLLSKSKTNETEEDVCSTTFSKPKKDNETELYDCNILYYYSLDSGATVKLEVWDGWSEFIRAALSGHEQLVSEHLSWDDNERFFQRKVALHIAAHFGYMGLAHAMLKSGTRADIPIGTHPSREWCSEGEHPETKDCAVHQACKRGNLAILRMFVKNNVLCLVSRDVKGRSPWQIVIDNSHKKCFRFLLARQWGRKSAKDFSLPILLYCRVMKWCERARTRAHLLYGTSKSTLRGRPMKGGALVGNSVAVDGLSSKPMTSKPLSAMPKPLVQPIKLLPALARARRRFKRQRSSVVFYNPNRALYKNRMDRNSSNPRFSSLSRRTSSRFSLGIDTRSTPYVAEESLNSVFNGDSAQKYKSEDKNSRTTIGKKASRIRKNATYISTGISNREGSIQKSDHCASSPILPSQVLGNERTPRKTRRSLRQWSEGSGTTTEERSSDPPSTTPASKKERIKPSTNLAKRVNSNASTSFTLKTLSSSSSIPLPSKSVSEYGKPYFYCGTLDVNESNDPIKLTLTSFEKYRGMHSRDNAINCLSLASTFTEKPWLKQLNMAVCLARRAVIRQIPEVRS